MMNMIKIIVLFFLFGFISCNNNRFKIYSKDKKCCISVVNNMNEKVRYIIANDSYDISKENYVKLSIDKIDPIAEEIIGYWNVNECTWVLYINDSSIIENKLDTVNFKLITELPTKEYGIPTLEPILIKDYFRVDMSYYEIVSSSGNILIEYW